MILQALATSLVATPLGWTALYAASPLPPETTTPLKTAKAAALQSGSTPTAIGTNLVFTVLYVLFTVAGKTQNMKAVH